MARHRSSDLTERTESDVQQPTVTRPVAVSLFLSLRPEQWTKNLIIFAGLMFGQRLLDPTSVAQAVGAFAIFCALSGVVYLINDVADREADRSHPVKRRRPIASGALPVAGALGAAAALAAGALGGAFWLRPQFGLLATAYLGLVLRAAAGAVAIGVAASHWLYIMTMLLALFLALAKRRHELVLLADRATGHRRILEEYSPYLLDQMIAVVSASTIVAYAFYTVSPETVAKFGTDLLGLTLPFPLYGIFRYLYLVHQREGGGSPADMLLTDRPLLACVGLWAAVVAVILYSPALQGL
jgi:4-hydroxybenzoate polyprenyltransferase